MGVKVWRLERDSAGDFAARQVGQEGRAGEAALAAVGLIWLQISRYYAIYGIIMWKIELLDDGVLRELNALPADQRAKFARITEIIQDHGLENVREPYVKHLEQGLWEIRMKGRDGISRAFYVIAKPRRVVVVRIFRKKTQKTPRREIMLALERAREIR